jgi:hypothetical protein
LDNILLATLNGLTLGLASTLHCAGMCSAISSGLLCPGKTSPADAKRNFVLTHLGRIFAYAIAGTAVGFFGAPAIGWLDREAAFRVLQWAGATTLVWIGLATVGVMPSISILDRALSFLSGRLALTNGFSSSGALKPLVAGIVWGLMPCAMVYGALFLAMLSGSPDRGTLVMLGFGIGTLPGLTMTSFGIRAISRTASRHARRTIAGLAIAAFGIATLFVKHAPGEVICTSPNASAKTAAGVTRINGQNQSHVSLREISSREEE